MIAFNEESLIVLAIGCLILNYFAFRSDAATAGHGRKAVFRMILIWIAVIAGLAAAIGFMQR